MFPPIDPDWAQRTFPNVYQAFGADLARQVNVYNSVVASRVWESTGRPSIFGAMYRAGVRAPNPHRPILNMLSALHDPSFNQAIATGWLFRLETLLGDAVQAEISPTLFRDMIRSSVSFFDLIAELEWGSVLRRISADFAPHSMTAPDSNRNFDIRWTHQSLRLLADVKFFRSWFNRGRGVDPANTILQLLRPDIRHHLYVSLEDRELSEDLAIDAAVEIFDCYQAGLAGTSVGELLVNTDDRETVICNRSDNCIVSRVRFRREQKLEPHRAGLMVTQCGWVDDTRRIRDNVLRAVSQLPIPGDNEISCLLLGSSSTDEADDVADVAFGPLTYDPQTGQSVYCGGGVLDPNAAEPDFQHLQAIVHFAIWLAPDAEDVQVAHARRACHLFAKDAVLNDEKRQWLQGIIHAFEAPETVCVVTHVP